MNLRKAFQFGLGGILGGLITLSIGMILYATPLGRSLTNTSYNLFFIPRPPLPADDVVVVYMDDESHDKLGQSYIAPWNRGLHAKLLRRLKAEGAKAIVMDIVFSDLMTNNPAVDDDLAAAIKEAGNVILAADYVRGGRDEAAARRVNLAHDKFLEGVANVGIAETQPDADLVVRQYFPGDKDDLVSSLSWATAEFVGAPVTKDPAIKYDERWINYYGPPLHIPHYSYYRVVSDETEVRTPPNAFRNKVVFVGAHIVTYLQGQRKDEYRSPYSSFVKEDISSVLFMPGTEIHANAVLNLLHNSWLTRLPRGQEQLMIILYGCFFGIVLAHLRPFIALVVTIISMVGTTVSSYYVFSEFRIWSPWLIVVAAQIPAAMLWSVVFNSVNLYVQKRLMQQSLSMYVSPSRVKQILKNPKILQPGAEKQEVSVLFSDIANFTMMSEGMDSDELAKLMNTYFETTVSHCIDPAQGTVVKFIGDAIFALWNAPEPQVNHQELACKGALLLRDSVNSFSFNKPGMVVRTRIGLHAGLANVGNFGSRRRVDYTALGENINLASRMEGLNKYLGTDVLITGEIQNPVKDVYITRYAGQFQLKGFEKAVSVYELIGYPDQAEKSRAWRDSYENAVRLFEKNDLDGAEAGFRCTLEIRPNDGPSNFFLKHIKELRAHPPEGEWTGVVELAEK